MRPLPRAAAWSLTLALSGIGTGAAAPVAFELRVEVASRQIAPGEPVRVVVTSGRTSLAAVEGSFLDEPLFFVRDPASNPAGADATRWLAWSLVSLARKPGKGSLVVRARADDGATRRVDRALRVLPKAFPVQRLDVESKYVTPPPEVERRIADERERLARVYATRTASAPDLVPFVRPVPGEPTSIFGAKRVYNGEPRDPHPGLDLRAATGTPVRTSGAGRVALAEDLYFSGGTVIVDHGGGLFTIYGHLSRIDVHAGDRVRPGEVLGASGATGRVTGPHLHWGAKIGEKPFDPTALLDERLFGGAPSVK